MNINMMSIAYAFRPRLRVRLTLSGLPLLKEPLDLRRTGFSPVLTLLVPALSLPFRPAVVTVCLQPTMERSPTTHTRMYEFQASVTCLSPVNSRRRDT